MTDYQGRKQLPLKHVENSYVNTSGLLAKKMYVGGVTVRLWVWIKEMVWGRQPPVSAKTLPLLVSISFKSNKYDNPENRFLCLA